MDGASRDANLAPLDTIEFASQSPIEERVAAAAGPVGNDACTEELQAWTETKANGSPAASSSPTASQSPLWDTRNFGPPYWQSVAAVGVQVAEALHYAHTHHTLHRDIKPANLLLDSQGVVWITDFGLAKAAEQDRVTQTGAIVGTLRYMVPENLSGQADARSDVYSLGLTLYELLTLKPAFEDPSNAGLIRKITREEPLRPRKLNPAVPRDLETIVLKAIAREPADRYPSAGELAHDIQCFLEDRPIQARRVPALERLRAVVAAQPGRSRFGGKHAGAAPCGGRRRERGLRADGAGQRRGGKTA